MISFAKAVKYAAKGRVALIGPAGSGKSYSALILARALVGPTGKIAAIDTEHGSLSKYADLFDFDVVELDSYSPANFLEALRAAEKAKYDAFVTDSLSHFWIGKDGALEFVDVAKKRSSSRDDMSGWREFRPHERAMVDAMIASPLHIICTMRTKTAYEEQVNERTGKKQRIKIGLAPVQREGLEYEFDLVGLMDEDNTLIVDKTRCSFYSGKALTKPKAEDFAPFRDWLSGAMPVVSQPSAGAPAPEEKPKVTVMTIEATVKNAVTKKTDGNKEYIVVSFQSPVNGYQVAFCWHKSLFAALGFTPANLCKFTTKKSKDNLVIEDVLDIGGQPYREGKPFTENLDAEPEPEPPTEDRTSLEITDADLPEELFA